MRRFQLPAPAASEELSSQSIETVRSVAELETMVNGNSKAAVVAAAPQKPTTPNKAAHAPIGQRR